LSSPQFLTGSTTVQIGAFLMGEGTQKWPGGNGGKSTTISIWTFSSENLAPPL